MLSIASGALAGVCCVLLAPRLPALAACVSMCALFAALGFALRWHWMPAIAVGIACATVDAHARMSNWLARNLESEKITVTGIVCSVPQIKPQGVRFRFEVETPRGLPRIVELSWYDANAIPRAAERWSLEVRLRRPRGFANPGGSDLAARLLRDRIGATGYVRSGRRLPARAGDGLRWPVLRLRAQIADSVRAALGTRPATGIIVGLAVGLQDALSAEQWQALSRSGTSHLMAISGLHIGMVAAVFAWLARVLWRRCQLRGSGGATRDAAVIAGTVAAAAYSALAGASVPTERTLIMIAVAAAAFHRRRNASVVDGLSVAVLAVLALDPLAPLAPGFWLSFGAVAAIVSVMNGHIVRPSAWVTWMTPQLAVTVGLVPVLAYAFGGISIVSAVVNLPAIPLYTLVIVPWTLLGSTIALIDPGWGRVALDPVAWLIEWSWPIISVPAHWSLALWTVAVPGMWGGALMIFGVAASLMPLGAAARGAGATIVVCVCTWPPSVPAPGHAHVAVLDVGQGLAVVIRTQHHALVYDTGPAFRSGSDAGQLVVVPYLRTRGVRAVDALVVSHDDADHAGGARSVVESIAVSERIASGHALDQFPIVRRCNAGWTWVWDGVRFEWMNREPGTDARDNDRSCVLLVEALGRRLLLTGDIEAQGESRLLDQRRLPQVDVVVVPHHGSRSSSSPEFVARTAPRWAIVSAGYLNRWGFPRPEVVSRWRDAGAEVLTTADSGAIEFELGTGHLGTPHRFRLERHRFWQEQ